MAKAKIQELLTGAARRLKRKGADYADLRWALVLHEELIVQNLQVHHVSFSTSEGISARVLARGAWGHAAGSRLDSEGIVQTADRAMEMAKALAQSASLHVKLYPVQPAKAHYRTPLTVDPFTVDRQKKLDYLMWACQVLKDHPNIRTAKTVLEFYKTHKWFVSTEGAAIEQEITESGGMIEATAVLDNEVQRRSYPSANSSCLAQAGYESVKSLDFVKEAARVRQEAVALLRARPCPHEETTVILMPDQLILQIHESCGHAAELDRALGLELSFAGSSFLTPDLLGKYRYGAKQVNITADGTTPAGCGTFAYDDEGVAAQRVALIREGIFTGYLNSRETAPKIRRPPMGAMRADGWAAVPIIRMTNVNLEPGTGRLEDLVRDTKRGILMATNKSWSIDDRRLNFQFGTQIAWEIRQGRVTQPLKNPMYTGITPEFWGRCSGVAGEQEWKLYGVPNCGKGEPVQSMHVGHGTAPARFEKVQVGRKK